MTALVIPGVRVEARFDVVPPPPSPSGILGLAGIVDRAGAGLAAVTSTAEIAEVFGPGTVHSLPELVDALRNGASEVVVSPVAAAAAGTGSLTLADRDGEDIVVLRARAPGPWADDVAVQVDEVLGPDGRSVRSVDVSVYKGAGLLESHRNLIMDPRTPTRDLFRVLNRDSTVLVALDAHLLAENPTGVTDGGELAVREPARAARILTAGGVDALRIRSKSAGEGGNAISVEVVAGRPAAVLSDDEDPTLRVTARAATGPDIEVTVAAGTVADTVTVTVVQGTTDEQFADLRTVGAIVTALSTSEIVRAEPIAGGGLPAVGTTTLGDTRTLVVRPAGADELVAADRRSVSEVIEALAGNPFVDAEELAPTTEPLDATEANSGFLTGGRGQAPAVRLTAPAGEVAEVAAAPGQDPQGWVLALATTSGGFRLTLSREGNRLERHDDLSMDPDSERYLPAVLERESERLVAADLLVRSRTSVLPRATGGRRPLSASAPAPTSAYLAAIDALADDERIDLLAASVQVHGHANLDVRQVHGALRALADAAADRGAPAIAFGSVGPAEDDVAEILDHANEVRSSRFVLCAPHGTHAAVAGLIGRLAVHRSPTFKGVPSLAVDPGLFRESELRRLVDPTTGNVLVVQRHRSRGIIIVKGVATNGWQINVTRTADAAVREIKKIAEGFIGELNDQASRTSLAQQVTAYLLGLERDGAIVPSTDGEDPAFTSRVYASGLDFAQGIVRIDIAIRPVRAIDYVYATIRVKAM